MKDALADRLPARLRLRPRCRTMSQGQIARDAAHAESVGGWISTVAGVLQGAVCRRQCAWRLSSSAASTSIRCDRWSRNTSRRFVHASEQDWRDRRSAAWRRHASSIAPSQRATVILSPATRSPNGTCDCRGRDGRCCSCAWLTIAEVRRTTASLAAMCRGCRTRRYVS